MSTRHTPRLQGLLCLLFATLATAAFAQTPTGTFEGQVKDPSGAAIVGATVTIANVATGEAKHVVTEPSGRFVQPFLLPGSYAITVTASGFRSARQENLKLDVGQQYGVVFSLEVQGVVTTVDVQSTTPPLDTESSSLGQVIEKQRVQDLPLNGRDVFSLVNLAPNVQPVAGRGQGIGGVTPSIGGSEAGRSDITIDGVSTMVPENTSTGAAAYEPIVDSVQEFNVVSGTPPAEYGRSGGGVVNVATKSGTDSYHGSVFYFRRDSALDANTFFNNYYGTAKPDFKRTQFGGTMGGPIVIPKIYNGRHKTFFFYGFEKTILPAGGLVATAVPLSGWRNGDFSDGFKPIFDPASATPDPNHPGSWIRQQYSGNIMPLAIQDPVAKAVMKYYPDPNVAGAATGTNNFVINATSPSSSYRTDTRIDENFTSNWRMFVRVSRASGDQSNTNILGNVATAPANVANRYWNTSMDHTITMTPTLILDFRYGYSRSYTAVGNYPSFDVTKLGYSQSYASWIEASYFPTYQFAGYGNWQQLGTAPWGIFDQAPSTHNVSASMTKILSRHTIKAGGEFRKLLYNTIYPQLPSGLFLEDTTWTCGATIDCASNGNPFASFLTGGIGSWGGAATHDASTAMASGYGAAYAQDDFKVSSKLTINIGLRYDLETPRTDRFNQLSYFDPKTPSPIAAQVAAGADSQLCPACAHLMGATYFVGQSNSLYGRSQVPSPVGKLNFAPRFGFAWQAAKNTVIRGGYALMYEQSSMTANGTSVNPGLDGTTTQDGFNTTVGATDQIHASISNPYPDGLPPLPLGHKAGLGLNIGQGLSNYMINPGRLPYVQQWNVNVQRELPGGMMFELGYMRNKGLFQYAAYIAGANGISLSQLPLSDMALADQLNVQVSNPFQGIAPVTTGLGANSTVSRATLLSPYPQYSGVNTIHIPDAYTSLYNSFTARFDKRFSHGLSLMAAFTKSQLKSNSQNSITDNYNLMRDWSLSQQDIPYRLVGNFIYQLPFGRGEKYLSNAPLAVRALVGGWQANGIVTWQGGQPLAMGGGSAPTGVGNGFTPLNFVSGQDPSLSDPTIQGWFNTKAFANNAPYTLGNVPRTLGNVRGPGLTNIDFSLFKNNFFGKERRFNAQYRLEMFNTFNHPFFSNPDTGLTDADFGKITSTVPDTQRQIQMALKFIF